MVCNLSILVLTLFEKTGKILEIFSLSGKTPDEKETLKSTDILYANFIIFEGMLLGPVALLLLRSDSMSMISLFVHGLMKIDSLHGFFKKRFKDLWAKLIFHWIFGATEQKKLLNELAISLGAVRKVSLSFIILGISESLHLRK